MFSRAGKSKIVKNASKIDKDANITENYLDKETSEVNVSFDTLSGVLHEGNRKTMPDFMSKLAEDQNTIIEENPDAEEPEAIDLIMEFDDEPVTRAGDVTSDESRVLEGFEVAKPNTDQIQKETEILLAEGHDLPQIAEDLKKKFPEKSINKFLETHRTELLQKYGQLGFIYLDKRLYDSCEDMNNHLKRLSKTRTLISKLKESETAKVKCRDCIRYRNGYCLLTNLKVSNTPTASTENEARFIINKFASIDSSIRDQYKERLKKEGPAEVVSSFLSSVEQLRRESGKKDSAFKRDIDQKEMKERLVDNNNAKNSALKEAMINQAIIQDLKTHIQAGRNTKEINAKLLETYKPMQLALVYKKYAKAIDKMVKFFNRNKEALIERFENVGSKQDVKNVSKKDSFKQVQLFKKMMNHADLLLTEGKEPKEIEASLKSQFGISETINFMQANSSILNKHYGQIGYIYVDANLYENCDKMKQAISSFKHVGKSLLYNVKACQNCKECPQNASGCCKKVGLMISNNPVVRSQRAASKVFKRTSSVVPQEYIDKFSKKLSVFGNAKIVSEFNLGLKTLAETDAIAKTASINTETQKNFKAVDTLKTDIFKTSSVSKIADEVLKA